MIKAEITSLEARIIDCLNHYDVMRLISLGAPKDEYEDEAKEIVEALFTSQNEDELQQAVHQIFEDSFSVSLDKNMFEPIAKDIWKHRLYFCW